jgi:hypothetical protein
MVIKNLKESDKLTTENYIGVRQHFVHGISVAVVA